MDELARCIQEQASMAELIRDGSPEQFGLRLGIQDWLKEEAILRGEIVAELPRSGCNETQRSATP